MSDSDQQRVIDSYIEGRFKLNEMLQAMDKETLIRVINGLVDENDGFWESMGEKGKGENK